MKKTLAFILLLITLTAVFTPCCGYDDCSETEVAAGSGQEEEEDNCSPFVACGYCTGFTQINTAGEEPLMIPVVIAHYQRDAEWLSSTYSNQLLQPPKFV